MKLFCAASILLCSLTAQAQLNVFTSDKGPSPYSKAKREAMREELKQSTTVFVLQTDDYNHQADFEQAIGNNWKFNPWKIIRPEELKNYEGKQGYSFFTFGAYFTGKHHNTLHTIYYLWSPMLNKKGKQRTPYNHAVVLMYPNFDARFNLRNYASDRNKFHGENLSPFLDTNTFYNWNAAYLGGYLNTINRQLMMNEKMDGWYDYQLPALADLKDDTLFIPCYVRYKQETWTRGWHIDTTLNERSIHEFYPYAIQFISSEELNHRIVQNSRDTKYMVMAIDDANKYLSVYSSHTGLQYNRMTMMSWTLKNKDWERLTRAVHGEK